MKPLQLASLFCATFALVHQAAAEWFVRPSALYVNYQNSGYGDNTGLSLATGTTFGSRAQHELSVEVASLKWSISQYNVWYTTGSGHFVTYLAHYRFRFGPNDSRLRFYLGPSLGLANFRGNLTQYRFGVIAHDSLGRWPLAYGGTFGVTLKLTDITELDVGYRYLYIARSDSSPNSAYLHIPTVATKANLLQAGLRFRF
jgi:opacity protein-like surface antigen